MSEYFGTGIAIERAFLKANDINTFKHVAQAHRDEYHLFFLLEKGSTSIEIDFQKHHIQPESIVYIHPGQVHRVLTFEHLTLGFLAIKNENLRPQYLKLLEDLTPVPPLILNKETCSVLSDAISFSIKLMGRTQEKLHRTLLKDSCNTVVALIISQFLEQDKTTGKPNRFELVSKAFRNLLEHNFIQVKSPAAYAEKLNISTSYLNECVNNATGHSVSHHIRARIILEAKRLLYHSNKSVKEIAGTLGYNDYPYFSRLFTKVTGMSALTFRNKNRE